MLTNLSVVLGAAGIYGELPFLLFWIAVIYELLRLLNRDDYCRDAFLPYTLS